MIYTFIPVVIPNEKEKRIAYLNLAHVEMIDPEAGKVYVPGVEETFYRLAPGWELDCNQKKIG